MDLQNVTTDEVRRDFAVTNLGWFPALTGAEVEAGFDKWLAGVKAAAKAEALQWALTMLDTTEDGYGEILVRAKELRAGAAQAGIEQGAGR